MKLLACVKCNDVFSLRVQDVRKCYCGESSGKYIDGLNAIYSGPCIPLGFANATFVRAIHESVRDERDGASRQMGREFTAFVIPHNAPTMRREGDNPVLDILK